MINSSAWHGNPAGDRTDIDNAATSGAAHAGQHQLYQAQQSEYIRFKGVVNCLRCNFFERTVLTVASIVHKYTNLTVFSFYCANSSAPRCFIGDIKLHRLTTVCSKVG